MEMRTEGTGVDALDEREMVSCQGGIAPLLIAIGVLVLAGGGAYGAGFVWGRLISTDGDCSDDDDSSRK